MPGKYDHYNTSSQVSGPGIFYKQNDYGTFSNKRFTTSQKEKVAHEQAIVTLIQSIFRTLLTFPNFNIDQEYLIQMIRQTGITNRAENYTTTGKNISALKTELITGWESSEKPTNLSDLKLNREKYYRQALIKLKNILPLESSRNTLGF